MIAAIYARKLTGQTRVSEEKEEPMTGVAFYGRYSSEGQRPAKEATH
jgi:hypothetical protein